MDLAPGRRARLLVALALVVLVALAARSGAEVITLTEETFSDKVCSSLLSLSRLPPSPPATMLFCSVDH